MPHSINYVSPYPDFNIIIYNRLINNSFKPANDSFNIKAFQIFTIMISIDPPCKIFNIFFTKHLKNGSRNSET